MRSSIIGIAFHDDISVMKHFIKKTTAITHSDPKAYYGSMAIALAASMSATCQPVDYPEYKIRLISALNDPEAGELFELIEFAHRSANQEDRTLDFAKKIGCTQGVSGYMYHTVPCVIQTWLRYQNDFSNGIKEIILAGGDTDTTAAILGGIIGARVGKDGIPTEWLNHIVEWPKTIHWIELLGIELSKVKKQEENCRIPHYFYPGVLLRNLLFLGVVLFHGFRRIFPPYGSSPL